MSKEPKVLVGVPLENNLPSECFHCFLKLARQGWEFIPKGSDLTHLNRNFFGKMLLKSDATHLVMLDSDHLHPEDVINRLVATVTSDPQRYQVVAGLNFGRRPPHWPSILEPQPDGSYDYLADWKPGLIKVAATGHATIIIAREVLERVPYPWWQFTYHPVTQNHISEDTGFCAACWKHNIEVWCDTTLVSPHLYAKPIGEQDFKLFYEKHGESLRDHVP